MRKVYFRARHRRSTCSGAGSVEHKFPLGGISATRVSRVHPERIEQLATRDT